VDAQDLLLPGGPRLDPREPAPALVHGLRHRGEPLGPLRVPGGAAVAREAGVLGDADAARDGHRR
jgi:hypothetical protein